MERRSRAYCFTINNYTLRDILQCFNFKQLPRYLCFGFEHDEIGTPHIQGYVYFDTLVRWIAMKETLHRAKIITAKGTIADNQVYTSKEGLEDWYSFGDPPEQGHATWLRIEDVMKDPKSNPHLYNQYSKMYRQLTLSQPKKHDRIMFKCHVRAKWKHASKYESVKMDNDEETYDGEEVWFVGPYNTFVDSWIHGYPRKVKRGYELITLDPRIVYLMYDTPTEYRFILKKYHEFIHIDAAQEDEEEFPSEEQTPGYEET